MGRAQGQKHGAVGGFEAVLGARRGSRDAQALRDSNERREHAAALKEFADRVEAASGSCSVVETLARIYHADYAQSDPRRHAALFEKLAERVGASTDEVATVAAFGDPVGWTGLTAPAVATLGLYFADPTQTAQTLIPQGQAAFVSNTCFSHTQYAEPHYLRLQPLVEGLAAFLARQTTRGGASLGMSAGRALYYAPTPTLVGPLSSLVTALAVRHDDGHLSFKERNILQTVITATISGSERERALAPLVERRIAPISGPHSM